MNTTVTRIVLRPVLLAPVLASLAACARDAGVPVEPPFVTRDSAGIQIMMSNRPLWEEGGGWRIADSASVMIGVEDGEAAYLLDRVVGAVRLSDGRIVVANSGSAELRFYGQDGRHVRTVGGRGQGPGEFRRPEHLLRIAGDTLVVWDAGLGPVSLFEPAGEFVRRDVIDPAQVMDIITMRLATERLTPLEDGSFILHTTLRGDPPEHGQPPGEIFRPPVGFYRFRRDFSRVDSLGWYGGLPQMYLELDGRRVYATVPVPAHARVAAGGSPLRIYAGNADTWDIDVYDAEGRRFRIIRRAHTPVPIPEDVIERSKASWSRAGHPYAAQHRRVIDAMPPQTHYPAYRSLFVDREGFLWVTSFAEGVHIFHPDGRWMGRVDIAGRLLDAGRDYVLVLTTDSLQVERVKLYPLARASG